MEHVRSATFAISALLISGCEGGATAGSGLGPAPVTNSTATPKPATSASPAATSTPTAPASATASPVPSSGITAAPAIVTLGTLGNEPTMAEAPDGTIYVSALANIYRSTDNGKTFAVAPEPAIAKTVLASDSSIDVAPNGRLYYTFDYPYAGNTAVCTSDDRANTWTCDPAVAPGGTDRMWVTAPGDDEAYETTNEGTYQTAFFDSNNGGSSWNVEQFGNNVLEPDTGPLVKIHNSSVVLQVLDEHPGRYVYRYVVSSPGLVPALADVVDTGIASDEALPSDAQDTAGDFYLVGDIANAAGGLGVQVGRSTDQGMTYSQLPMIPQTATGTATFTSVAAGKPGHIAVLYYSTAANGADVISMNVPWSVRVAETYDAFDAIPVWSVTTLEPVVHTGGMCANAGCTGDTRYSGDFITALIDANEHLSVTWVEEVGTAQTPTIRFARLH